MKIVRFTADGVMRVGALEGDAVVELPGVADTRDLIVGGAAMAAVLITVLGPPMHGWFAEVIGQPAAWTVPLAFTVMVFVSMATRRRIPGNVALTMLRLHAPDALRL